jgi:hypothetical protein
MTRPALILLCALTLAPPCGAGTLTQRRGDAAFEVRFDGDEPALALADLIEVTLTIEGGAGLVVQAPLELGGTEPWLLVERTRPTRDPLGKERIRWRITYRFAPREPGKLEFALPAVKFRAGDGPEQTATFDPIVFTVTTQAGELRPSTGIEELSKVTPPNQAWQFWTVLTVASACFLTLLLVLRRVLRREKPKTPTEHALHELQRLVALDLPEHGRSERFVTLLTTLVRRYLERQFALPARRQTTPEFLRALADASTLSAEEKHFLQSFLERCESVKFAAVPMSAAECAQLASETREFLRRRLVRQPA